MFVAGGVLFVDTCVKHLLSSNSNCKRDRCRVGADRESNIS
jgi:hypothetical protein